MSIHLFCLPRKKSLNLQVEIMILGIISVITLHSLMGLVKEAMEYKLERLNTTLIRSIYNTPIWCTAREPDLQQIYERLARKSRDVLST